MRIISKYKDFYDNITAYGVDMSQVFVREQSIIDETIQLITEQKTLNDFLRDLSILANPYNRKGFYVEVLYFCGKIYPIYFKDSSSFIDRRSANIHQYHVIGGTQDFLNEALNNKDIEITNLLFGSISLPYNLSREDKLLKTTQHIQSICDNQLVVDCIKQFSKKHKLAYFLSRFSYQNMELKSDVSIHTYPELKVLKLSSIIDGMQAFQQIEQYLFTDLSINERPMIELSDKIKASKHGHDGKYSFKKTPSNN